MNGIINVYKEQDFTSHDVVAKLRGICHMRKIGHTGTLDPMAVGVLPVCLGNATKLCDILTDHDKEYRCTMILGLVSDTYDITGVIEKTEGFRMPDIDTFNSVINSFAGGYEQVPPMYSAKKIDGKKLYELARAGITVEREAVFVDIPRITVLEILPEGKITLDIECGKGTYIRSLCNDIGEKLGCGAVMESLTRTRVGNFKIDNALKLGEIESCMTNGNLDSFVIKTEEVFSEYAKLKLKCDDRQADKILHNGNTFSSALAEYNATDMELVRIYDSASNFIGLYRYNRESSMYKPYKLFLPLQ